MRLSSSRDLRLMLMLCCLNQHKLTLKDRMQSRMRQAGITMREGVGGIEELHTRNRHKSCNGTRAWSVNINPTTRQDHHQYDPICSGQFWKPMRTLILPNISCIFSPHAMHAMWAWSTPLWSCWWFWPSISLDRTSHLWFGFLILILDPDPWSWSLIFDPWSWSLPGFGRGRGALELLIRTFTARLETVDLGLSAALATWDFVAAL